MSSSYSRILNSHVRNANDKAVVLGDLPFSIPMNVVQEAIDTSIAALVDTAPSTLNTLNELAAALGDDPNFATTVTNQIGDIANTLDVISGEVI